MSNLQVNVPDIGDFTDVTVIEILVKVGDTIKVIDGPLEGFLGTVEEVDSGKQRVRVIVSMFGRETPVDLEQYQVEYVSE